MTFEYYFQGRKPSKAQVTYKILEAINSGHIDVEISWGESMLTVCKFNSMWFGSGWIKNISGQDLASELSKKGRI